MRISSITQKFAMPSIRLSTPQEMFNKVKGVALPAILLFGMMEAPKAEAGFALLSLCIATCSAATGGGFIPACVAACAATLAAPTP